MSTDNELHAACEAVFSALMANPGPYGFHFSYSPESAWKKSTRFLVLTLNPQAKNSEKKLETIVPEKTWPETNDFFFRKVISHKDYRAGYFVGTCPPGVEAGRCRQSIAYRKSFR